MGKNVYQKCDELIDSIKKTGKKEITEKELISLIKKHIGYTDATIHTYFRALQEFGLIERNGAKFKVNTGTTQ